MFFSVDSIDKSPEQLIAEELGESYVSLQTVSSISVRNIEAIKITIKLQTNSWLENSKFPKGFILIVTRDSKNSNNWFSQKILPADTCAQSATTERHQILVVAS